MKEKLMGDPQMRNDMTDAEYQDYCRCNPDCGCKSVTGEESQEQYNAWWNSLNNSQKEQLYNDQAEAFQLSIDEMNDDLSFGK